MLEIIGEDGGPTGGTLNLLLLLLMLWTVIVIGIVIMIVIGRQCVNLGKHVVVMVFVVRRSNG